jgi:estrogen-related receptor beta like 1
MKDARDWREHLDQMKTLHATMGKDLSGTKSQLDKLYTDIGRALEKINTKEIHLNRQLEPHLQELRVIQVNKQ